MFCPKCGHKNPDDAAFCMKCGVGMQTLPATPPLPAWQAPNAPAQPGWGAPAHPPEATHAHPPVPPLQPEQEVWHGAMSWKGLLTFGWIAAFVVPIPLIIGAFSMRAHFAPHLWMLSLLSLIPLGAFGIRLWMLRTTTYRITTERISVLRGILSRESDDLQLMRVADVQFFQPLLGRLLNVGDIRVLSTDKTVPDLIIPAVQSPAEFKEMLWNLVRERRRNLVAMEQLNQGLNTPPAF